MKPHHNFLQSYSHANVLLFSKYLSDKRLQIEDDAKNIIKINDCQLCIAMGTRLSPQRIFMKSPWENTKILRNISHISLDQCHKWNCIIQSLS